MPHETGLIKNKKSRVLNLYIKPENQILYQQILSILERDGGTLSDFIWKRIAEYTLAHYQGNSQTLLEYAGLPQTLPLYQTCSHSRHEEDGRVALIKGLFYCHRPAFEMIPDACTRCRHYKEVVNE